MTRELEDLAIEQADDLADESAVTLKRRSVQPAKRKMPGASGNFKRLPFSKETARASESHNAAQPWELDPSLLPKLPPGRSK